MISVLKACVCQMSSADSWLGFQSLICVWSSLIFLTLLVYHGHSTKTIRICALELTTLNTSDSVWKSLINDVMSFDNGLFKTEFTFDDFYLKMLREPPAITWLVLEIMSETLSHDSCEGECLKKLFDVNLPDSLTEVLKNASVDDRLNSSSFEPDSSSF